jgi:hypothetical protein
LRPVAREELLDYETYGDRRDELRTRIFATKAARRVHVGPCLTFLFENRETVRYQIQEMMRAERIVREDAIRHEIDTYNELLGGPGELGCTLLVEIDDVGERAVKLAAWTDLPRHLYVRLEDDSRAYARYDERQVDPHKLSSVQYLKFRVDGSTPVAVGTDYPPVAIEIALTQEQRRALVEDLAD